MAQQTDTAGRRRRACVDECWCCAVRMSFSTAMLQCRILCRLEKQAGRRLRGLTEPGECAQPAVQSGRGGSLFVDGVTRAFALANSLCAPRPLGGGGGCVCVCGRWVELLRGRDGAQQDRTGQGRTGQDRTGQDRTGAHRTELQRCGCRCWPADGRRGGSAGGRGRCAVAKGRVVEISGDAHGRRRAARPDQRQSKINSGLVGGVSKRIRGVAGVRTMPGPRGESREEAEPVSHWGHGLDDRALTGLDPQTRAAGWGTATGTGPLGQAASSCTQARPSSASALSHLAARRPEH